MSHTAISRDRPPTNAMTNADRMKTTVWYPALAWCGVGGSRFADPRPREDPRLRPRDLAPHPRAVSCLLVFVACERLESARVCSAALLCPSLLRRPPCESPGACHCTTQPSPNTHTHHPLRLSRAPLEGHRRPAGATRWTRPHHGFAKQRPQAHARRFRPQHQPVAAEHPPLAQAQRVRGGRQRRRQWQEEAPQGQPRLRLLPPLAHDMRPPAALRALREARHWPPLPRRAARPS